MKNYYNEFDPKAAAALKQLIVDGLIPKGDVDVRSITEVPASDLAGYTQCHFFAGIGGWSHALRLAGWPTDRPVWTGSCPCQPFSTAGKQKGTADERHLWPVWFNLIRECKPTIVFGEQVASAVSHGWLDGVYADMEAEGYAIGSAVLPACSVNAPHKRDRLWFVGNSKHNGSSGTEKLCGNETASAKRGTEGENFPGELAGTGKSENVSGIQRSYIGERWDASPNGTMANGNEPRKQHPSDEQRPKMFKADGSCEGTGFWSDHEWIICGDGKARRIPTAQSGIRLLAHGFPERVGLLRAGGNAIVPEVAARFIKATDQAISGIW